MIESLYGNFKSLMEITWPMVFVSMIILISFRISFIYKNRVKIVIYKEILLFFFAFYVLSLFQAVTTTDASASVGSNFVPFKEIMRYEFYSPLFIKNVVGNVVLFLPYGYFVGRYFSGKNIFLNMFLVLLASISIEVTQLYIGRVFDVDDILLNVLGGLFGFLIYLVLDKVYEKLPKFLKATWFLNTILIILLGLFITLIVMLLM